MAMRILDEAKGKSFKMEYKEILFKLIQGPRLTKEMLFEGVAKNITDVIGVKAKNSDAGLAIRGSGWLGAYSDFTTYYMPSFDKNVVYAIRGEDGELDYLNDMYYRAEYRMVLPYSLIEDVCKDVEICGESRWGHTIYKATLPVDEIGSNVGREKRNELEKLLKEGQLKEIDSYPIDRVIIKEPQTAMYVVNTPIYEYSGKKYIRIVYNNHLKSTRLLNGEKYMKGDFVWLEMKQPTIFYDPATDLAIYEDLTIIGIRPVDLENYLQNHLFHRLAKQIKNAKDRLLNKNEIPTQSFDTSNLIKNFLKMCSGDVAFLRNYILENFQLDKAEILLMELKKQTEDKGFEPSGEKYYKK